jgi:tetratricopeptide (TPR) repeat protein
MNCANISLKSFWLTVVLSVFGVLSGFQNAAAQKSQTEVFLETLREAETKTNAKQWTEAAAVWEKIVKANPVEARYWNQLGNAYYSGKNYASAIKAYEKVLEIGGTPSSSAAYNIACNYALLGEKEQALKWLEKALDMGFPDLM